MKPLEVSTHVAASSEACFAAWTDFASLADRVQSIVKTERLDSGPVKVGSRYRETRVMMGREETQEMEVVAFDPPRSFTTGCEAHGCVYRCVYTFTPDGDGTKVTVSFGAELKTFAARMFSVLGVLFRGQVRKLMVATLEDMRKSVENG